MKNSHEFTENIQSLFFLLRSKRIAVIGYCFCFVLFCLFFLRFLSAVGRYFRENCEITEFQVTK